MFNRKKNNSEESGSSSMELPNQPPTANTQTKIVNFMHTIASPLVKTKKTKTPMQKEWSRRNHQNLSMGVSTPRKSIRELGIKVRKPRCVSKY